MEYTVYMHTSPSGKRYIGITKQEVHRRWAQGYKHNAYFFNAINKYGWDNFQHIIIATGLSKDSACSMEIDLIKQYRSNEHDFGYNESSGGECSGAGVVHTVSEETRQKMSSSHKGLQSGVNHPMYGKHHTEESKDRMRVAQQNLWQSSEYRDKMSKVLKGKTGHTFTEDQRRKLSEAMRGKHLSEEHRRKLSEAKKGKPSPRKGVKLSEETKQKISLAVRKGWM